MFSVSLDESVEADLDSALIERLEVQLVRMLHAAWLTEGTERELEADLRLCDDEAIQTLNRDYRGMDKPTDVLAFAQREGEGGDLCPEILGDIVISVPTAARQARADLYGELVFLCAHGLCHLLGYDHQDDEEERAMNTRMQALIVESQAQGDVSPA
jgi:probable rRNA maturation factor